MGFSRKNTMNMAWESHEKSINIPIPRFMAHEKTLTNKKTHEKAMK